MRRRNIILKHSLQLRLFIKSLIFLTLGIIVALVLVYAVSSYYSCRVENDKKLNEFSFMVLIYAIYALKVRIIVIFISILIAVFIFILFVAHPIVGPIYKIENILEDVIKGDLTQKIVLRKKDEFQTLSTLIDDLIRDFEDCVKVVNNKIGEIELYIDEQQDKFEENKIKKLKENIQLIKQRLQKYNFTEN